MSKSCGMFGCTDHAQGVCASWCDDCRSFLAVTPLRIAAIEAAKAWAEHAEQDPNDLSWDHQIHLFDATEALLAAEEVAP